MRVLNKLVGQSLITIDHGNGEAGLHFSDASLYVYNLITGDSPQKCVGANVTSVEYIERHALRLIFSNALQFAISLRDGDYVGPEAFCIRLGDGTIVVE